MTTENGFLSGKQLKGCKIRQLNFFGATVTGLKA